MVEGVCDSHLRVSNEMHTGFSGKTWNTANTWNE